MGTLLRKILKNEQGQALAEYHVLIPGTIIIVIAAAWLLTGAVSDAYCQAVSMFDPSACEGLFPAEEEATPEPEEDTDECVTVEESQGGSQCSQSEDCASLPGLNEGTWDSGGPDIQVFVIKAGVDYFIYNSGMTGDGCYFVNFDGPEITWERMGHGPNCKDISHMDAWFIPQCTPSGE